MSFIWRYMGKYKLRVFVTMFFKLVAAFGELLIPYILEHLIDNIAPTKDIKLVAVWGAAMISLAILVRYINMFANRSAVKTASRTIYHIRRDLFHKSIELSGSQMDEIGLPSLTSRMTSDSYNIQNFVRMFQTLGVRAPFMLVGGIIVTMTMDVGLSSILCVLTPILLVVIVIVSRKGIPLYDKVQRGMDQVVRVMRENITGIRVVKALSKEDYEIDRFSKVNNKMMGRERKAGVVMSLPGPIMTMTLNFGLTLVVVIGAYRVNDGLTQPGVILAFLTYFNMIMVSVMAINRVFMMMSKANASAKRIQLVVDSPSELTPIADTEAAHTDNKDFIVFEDVSFAYEGKSNMIDDMLETKDEMKNTADSFAGESRQKSLEKISFSIRSGGSLGIIGPTGCGKTTIINLLMRFYEAGEGHIFVDGRDVRTYSQDELHQLFGVVFQNDVVFADTLSSNIVFGRTVSEEDMKQAAKDAQAADFINAYDDKYEHMAAIHGANLSGGQRQRILITRALAGKHKILILDDASSALDYKTDARMRHAVSEHHSDASVIIVAQRVSSIMNMDEILVMDEGKIIGRGTHEELLKSCPAYFDIYKTQMGEGANVSGT